MGDPKHKPTTTATADVDSQQQALYPEVGAGRPGNGYGGGVPKTSAQLNEGPPPGPLVNWSKIRPGGAPGTTDGDQMPVASYNVNRLPEARHPQSRSGHAQHAQQTFYPPPDLKAGRVPGDAHIVELDTSPLAEAFPQAVTFDVLKDNEEYKKRFGILASDDLVRKNLNNMTNGSGLHAELPTVETAVSKFTGYCQIRAELVAFDQGVADGAAVQSSSSGGAAVGSADSASSSVGLGVSAGLKTGDAKAGLENSAGLSGTISDGTSETTSDSWSGTSTTGTAASPAVRFRFGVRFTVTVSIDHEPRPYANVLTLGQTDTHKSTNTVTAVSNGTLLLPAARCTPAA